MRAEQFLKQDLDFKKMRARIKRIRLEFIKAANKYISAKNRIYSVGDFILIYNFRFIIDRTADRKLIFRWLEPYRILKQNISKNIYIFKKLDNARLRGTYSGRRLKKFYSRTKTPKPFPFKYTRDADNLFKYKESDSDQKETENLEESNPGSKTELLDPGPRV